jgi:hypothetical protein
MNTLAFIIWDFVSSSSRVGASIGVVALTLF